MVPPSSVSPVTSAATALLMPKTLLESVTSLIRVSWMLSPSSTADRKPVTVMPWMVTLLALTVTPLPALPE
jgi:hypothetical protein